MTDSIQTDLVKISEANGVMEIVWNRPDKKNALSNAMYRAATAALARAVEDKSIRVVLLASEGDSFTSGNDLADFAAASMGGRRPPRTASSSHHPVPETHRRRRPRPRCRRRHDHAAPLRSRLRRQ